MAGMQDRSELHGNEDFCSLTCQNCCLLYTTYTHKEKMSCQVYVFHYLRTYSFLSSQDLRTCSIEAAIMSYSCMRVHQVPNGKIVVQNHGKLKCGPVKATWNEMDQEKCIYLFPAPSNSAGARLGTGKTMYEARSCGSTHTTLCVNHSW